MKRPIKKKTPYQRIIFASKNGTGVRLSYDECFDLSRDDAISTRATNDDLNDQGISDDELARRFGGRR